MKSIFHFLVQPKGGKRYDNVKDVGEGKKLVLSTSQEDHKATNRYAIVVAVPHDYNGEISVGDEVIVHHNVFRKFFDMKGRQKSGSAHVFEDYYVVEDIELFLYKKPDGDWMAPSPYMFVEPIASDNMGSFKKLYGKIAYSSDSMVSAGEEVSFQPDSEYEFKIDGKLMYRMYKRNLVWKNQ